MASIMITCVIFCDMIMEAERFLSLEFENENIGTRAELRKNLDQFEAFP
jgi:hypothetical protein